MADAKRRYRYLDVCPETDTCGRCKIELPIAQLVKDATKKFGYKAYCNGCARKNAKKQSLSDPLRMPRNKYYRRKSKQWLDDFKANKPCADCGRQFPACEWTSITSLQRVSESELAIY